VSSVRRVYLCGLVAVNAKTNLLHLGAECTT
jgi:hypothetical protein